MPLSEEVSLDIEEALRGISTIEDALGSAAQSFKVALAEALDVLGSVTVEDVDASAVTSGIDAAVAAADTQATVEGDASAVTDSIDAAVATADSTVTVEAITDEVTQQIEEAVAAADTTIEIEATAGGGLDGIKGDADAAGGSLTDLAGRASLLNDVLTAGSGSTSGLVSGLSKIGPEGAIAAAGLAVVTGVTKQYFDAALDARTATERFGAIFGSFADDIESLSFTGLNLTLKELALNLGADDDALRQAAADFAQLGLAAGNSQAEVAGSAEQLIVLASAVAAANPSLGTTEEVINRLGPALARGGRFAAQFGLDLDRAEVAARAVANANGDASAATDQFALRQAGLQLALEQIPDVADRIDKGFDKPIVKLRAFQQAQKEAQEAGGESLVDPLIAAFEALGPVIEPIIRLLGAGLGTALRVVIASLAQFYPILLLVGKAAGLFASFLEVVNRAMDRLGGFAIEKLKAGLRTLIETFNKIPILPNISTKFLEAGNAASSAAGGADQFAGSIDHVTQAALAADEALGKAFGFAGDLFSAQQGAVDASRAVRDAEEAVAEARKGGAGASKSATERALEYRQAQLGIAQAQSGLIDANEALTESQQKLNDLYVLTEDELKAIEDAQRSLEQVQRGYREATDRVTEAQQRLAEVTRAATAAEADKARRDVRRAELSEADALDRLEDAQKRADAANLALSRSAGRSQRVRDAAAEAASDAERELAKAQLDVADASDRKREAGEKADDQLDGTIGTTEQITEAQKALETALQSQADAALAVAEAQKGVAAAQAATVVTAKELHDAERDVEKAQLAQQAAALAVAQAEQGVQTSQSGSTTSSHALRNALEQLESARLRQAEAIAKERDALASADGSQVTHREQIQNTIDVLSAFALTLDPGSPLRRNLDAYIASLRLLLNPIKVKIDADTKPARAPIKKFIEDINRSLFSGPSSGIPSLSAAGTGLPPLSAAGPDGFASGTDFFGGGLAVVGERGRELVALPRGSAIANNNQTERFIEGMGGTTNITVNQVANDPEATAFAVGARLGAASQR